MSIPTASTTDLELWRTYDDAALYDVVRSAALAADFVVACRLILRRRPVRATLDGTAIDFESVREDLQRAERWLGVNGNGAASNGPRHLDFRRLRD
jgi:hypothetical protein